MLKMSTNHNGKQSQISPLSLSFLPFHFTIFFRTFPAIKPLPTNTVPSNRLVTNRLPDTIEELQKQLLIYIELKDAWETKSNATSKEYNNKIKEIKELLQKDKEHEQRERDVDGIIAQLEQQHDVNKTQLEQCIKIHDQLKAQYATTLQALQRSEKQKQVFETRIADLEKLHDVELTQLRQCRIILEQVKAKSVKTLEDLKQKEQQEGVF